jgi:hypothetical protein
VVSVAGFDFLSALSAGAGVARLLHPLSARASISRSARGPHGFPRSSWLFQVLTSPSDQKSRFPVLASVLVACGHRSIFSSRFHGKVVVGSSMIRALLDFSSWLSRT